MHPSRVLPKPLRLAPLALAVLWATGISATSGCGGSQKSGSAGKPDGAPPDMILVPEGEFLMGRQATDAATDEVPEHRVWIDAFYLDRTEVTNAQFKAFCDATQRLYPNNPMWESDYFIAKPEYPVVNITYDQARGYCEWAGKRLPTEAEWEKAARGTDGRLYPWGNEWKEDVANLNGEKGADTYIHTAPVGSFPDGASPFGILDMIGNVWEWCADWSDPDYYAKSPKRNPQGPTGPLPWRSVRGGGFSSPRRPTGDTTVTNRSKNPPNLPVHHIGCRCAWPAKKR
jgi:sulfatase modifying factor 1